MFREMAYGRSNRKRMGFLQFVGLGHGAMLLLFCVVQSLKLYACTNRSALPFGAAKASVIRGVMRVPSSA